MERKAGNGAVKRGLGKGEAGCLTQLPLDVVQLLFSLKPLCALQHGGNCIQANDSANTLSEKAGDDSWAASDVEQRVASADLGAVSHQLQQPIHAVRMALQERHSLFCELILYLGIVLGGIHEYDSNLRNPGKRKGHSHGVAPSSEAESR